MKRAIIILSFAIVTAVVAGGFRGSHPTHPNNGKSSPRFYASPPSHPSHP